MDEKAANVPFPRIVIPEIKVSLASLEEDMPIKDPNSPSTSEVSEGDPAIAMSTDRSICFGNNGIS